MCVCVCKAVVVEAAVCMYSGIFVIVTGGTTGVYVHQLSKRRSQVMIIIGEWGLLDLEITGGGAMHL